MSHTEKSIAQIVAGYYGYSKNIVLCNYATGLFGWEADVVIVRPSGWAEEVEIKISKSDFRAEFKNKPRKHRIIAEGKPKYVAKPISTRAYHESLKLPTTEFDEWVRLVNAPTSEISSTFRRGEAYALYDWATTTPHHAKKYWFAMPEDLGHELLDEIPEHAGLYIVKNGSLRILKEAPILEHGQKCTEGMVQHILKCAYYRYWDYHRKESGS